MRLGMTMTMTQVIHCRACMGTAAEHEHGCPIAGLEAYQRTLKQWSCPTCNAPGYPVEADMDDWLTCRKCLARYSAGMVGGDMDEGTFTLLPISDAFDAVVTAYRFKARAKRRGFRWRSDVVVAQYEASIKMCAKLVRERRRDRRGR